MTKTFVNDEYQVEILLDENPMSPRDACNIGMIVCPKIGLNEVKVKDMHKGNFQGLMHEIARTLKAQGDAPVAAVNIYALDHSGVYIKAGDHDVFSNQYMGMDSGLAGVIVATRMTIKETMGWTRMTKQRTAEVIKQLTAEVDEYNSYMNDPHYGYVVYQKHADQYCDSCWGYASPEEALKAGTEAANSLLTQRQNSWLKHQLALPIGG